MFFPISLSSSLLGKGIGFLRKHYGLRILEIKFTAVRRIHQLRCDLCGFNRLYLQQRCVWEVGLRFIRGGDFCGTIFMPSKQITTWKIEQLFINRCRRRKILSTLEYFNYFNQSHCHLQHLIGSILHRTMFLAQQEYDRISLASSNPSWLLHEQ